MTVQERIEQIKANALAQTEKRQLELLDTTSGINNYLAGEDRKLLTAISSRIASAYDKPTVTGYQFSENVELIVAITSRLQYANKSVRELLEPGTDELDLYSIFDRGIRDDILSAYGSLPYSREATIIMLPDNSIEVLDAELVAEARVGKPCNIELLNASLEIISLRLGLYGQYKATQEQADTAWKSATAKLVQVEKLEAYKQSLQA